MKHRSSLCLAILSTMLIGCPKEAATPPVPTGAPRAPRMTVGVLEHASAIPIVLAKTAGLFEKHGIDVALVTLTPQEHMPALVAGRVDALSPSSFPVILSTAQQHPQAILAYMTGGESTKGDVIYGLVVRPSSTYQRLGQLQGRTIGSASRFTTVNLRNVLRSHFQDTTDSTRIRDIADRALILDGVVKGDFDAAVLDQPALASALVGGDVRLIEPNFRARYITDPYWSGSGVAARRFTEQSPEVFQHYLDAIDEALGMIERDPTGARAVFLKHFKTQNVPPDAIGMYVYPGARFAPPEQFIADLVATLRESKLLEERDVDDDLFRIR